MTATPSPMPSAQVPAKVYEPTVTGLPPLMPYLAGMWARRPLIWHLARSGLKAENYTTFMGQAWIILDPLLMAGVYYLVRTVVRPTGASIDRNDLITHLIAGVFFFQFTSRSLMNGARSLVNNKAMILNSSFPRAVFPIVSIVEGILDLAPMLVVYFAVHMLLDQPVGSSLLFLPVLFVLQLLFTCGLTLTFAPLTARFHDTKKFLPYFTRIWLFTTPILWTVREMPDNVGWLIFNPLYPYFAALEQIFDGVTPSPWYLLSAAGYAIVAMVVGIVTFLRLERDVASHF